MRLLIAILLALDAPAAQSAPAPEPTPLREIARVNARSLCSALNELALPVALVVQRNDRDFVGVRTALVRFAGGSVGPGTPPIAGDPAAAGDLDEGGDDASTYTPERTLAASNIDRLTSAILTNLEEADRAMNRSWKSHPAHTNPAYDAYRQRVQNVIDLQRVLAFRLDDVAGMYFSNAGTRASLRNAEVAEFQSGLDRTIAAQLSADVKAEDPLSLDPGNLPSGDVAATKNGSASEVAAALRVQKLALALESEHLARTCDGLPPAPAPTSMPP
jgi:hypothetical protein